MTGRQLNKEIFGSFEKVKNMENDEGRAIPNQFIITTDKGSVFQSYWSVIAAYANGKIYLDENKWDYSVTTGKYRNRFLGIDKKETLKQIKEGKIILANLN